VPRGTGPLPSGRNLGGEAPSQILLRLAHLGQRLGDHQTALGLLARASAITTKNLTDAPPGADFLLASIARAQAFSGAFAGAKVTQRAALTYQSTLRYFDEQSKAGSRLQRRACDGHGAHTRPFSG
jgi:hypothetical protein